MAEVDLEEVEEEVAEATGEVATESQPLASGNAGTVGRKVISDEIV